jgi:two-component sensor histidine kinase/CheY-like chemotaxis protein
MTAPKASGKSPPAVPQPEIADRRRAIVADIRHDLKNARLAAAAALRQLGELANDGPLKAAIAGLEAAVGELAVHSERGLELLSLGVDDVEAVLEPMALEPILREVEIARRAAAEQAGIDLRTFPSGAVAAVDASLLGRCVGNLVSNAIEHSGASRVLVGVRRRGAGCVIEVRDNGRGIDPEAVQGMQGRRWAEGSGRGLGLWIAARFATLLGGELEVRGRAGRGSCFRIRLPGPVSWAPGSPRAACPNRVRLDGRAVVLLEDDPAQLQATRLAFERRGATVIAARNQVEFWNEIEQLSRPPDLCVLDFVLGRANSALMEGGAATSANDLAWLRKRFGDQTRAVVLTANSTHPQLATIGDTPMFEKPLNDADINAIGALLQSLQVRAS